MTPGNAGVWVPPKVLLQLPLLPSPLLLLRLRGEVPPEAERQDAVPGVPRLRRGSGRGVRLPRGGGLPEDPLDQEGASLRAGPAFGRTARGRGPGPGDAAAPETGSVPEAPVRRPASRPSRASEACSVRVAPLLEAFRHFFSRPGVVLQGPSPGLGFLSRNYKWPRGFPG